MNKEENINLEVNLIIEIFGFKFNSKVEKHLESRKIPSDMINKIKNVIDERHKKVLDNAKKIASKINNKYGNDVSLEDLKNLIKEKKNSYIARYNLVSKYGFNHLLKNIIRAYKLFSYDEEVKISNTNDNFKIKYTGNDLKNLKSIYKNNYMLYRQV